MTGKPVVLVVDDDAGNRELVGAWLQGGCATRQAASGPEALELVQREPVDLVILDVMMSEMSGYDTCREIKKIAGDQVLPVLLLTALSEQVDRNAGLEAGADDFLVKPVDRHELRMRVSAFLKLRAQDRQLRQQLEELRHLTELKDDLVTLLVHDLRNPLSAVLALLDILRADIRDPQLQEDAVQALAGAARIRDALEDILQVRLLEEDRLAPELRPVEVAGLVREAVGSIAPSAREHQVSIALTATEGVTVPLDRKLVRRAVDNLLANAVRYSPRRGTVEVAVRAEGGGLVIEVADRGPALPDPLRASTFEKYGAVEMARHAERRGYGLSLYLVKLVAGAHRGRVLVRARDGGGSGFGLWLPARTAP